MAKFGFIIIGRNEGKRLGNCIKSIYDVVKANDLKYHEIIYVDSNSTDNSIEVAQQFPEVKIFKITSKTNAAVGRNIGASQSTADILCFIDGDMELIPDFFTKILTSEKELVYDFISGQFDNYYHDNNGTFLFTQPYHSELASGDKYQVTTGGLFIIKRSHWLKLKGMRTRLKMCEDLDLGLRMAKMGYKLLRKKDLLAKHFTIHYKDFSRMWTDLKLGKPRYRAVLYRLHWNNKFIFYRIAKSDPSLVLLVFSIVCSLIFLNPLLLIIYPAITFIFSLIKEHSGVLKIFNRYFFQIARDLMVFFSLFLFFPKDLEYTYIHVK